MPQRWIWLGIPILVALVLLFNQCNSNSELAGEQTGFRNLHDTVSYVGMETCRSCHANVYDTYIKTGMGQSFGLATREKSAAEYGTHQVVYDSINNFWYHPFWQNDSLFIKEYRLAGTDTTHQLIRQIDYVIGSGQHTNSHLLSQNGYITQAPITYYTQSGRWDLAPGFEGGFNSRFSRIIGHECMTCHNGLPDFAEGSLNKYEQVKLGIDCERCHGPGSLHVQEKRQGIIVDTSKAIDYSIVNPRHLDKEEQMSLCQRCHLQGVAVLNDGQDWQDFKPGMHLKDVMNVFLPRYSGAENQFIMASQADRLRMSKCYTSTDMTCITCHNPHISVKETTIGKFNSACTNCHAGTAQSTSQLLCSAPQAKRDAADDNCSGCHMPKSGSIDIPHVSISDHYIRKQYDTIDYAISVDEVNEVKQFLGLECLTNDNPDALTKARGYLNFYDKFSSRAYVLDSAKFYLDQLDGVKLTNVDAFVYWAFLKDDFNTVLSYADRLDSTQITDGWTLYRIGEAATKMQQFERALYYYAAAAEQLPLEPDFKNKQAAMLVALGNPSDAFRIFEEILLMQPNHKEACANLAYLTMLRGNYRQADTLLSRALQLDPDYTQAKLNSAILYIQQRKKAEARKILVELIQAEPDNEQARQLLQMM